MLLYAAPPPAAAGADRGKAAQGAERHREAASCTADGLRWGGGLQVRRLLERLQPHEVDDDPGPARPEDVKVRTVRVMKPP